ncbi:MAG: hypothetical protein JXN61_06805 [Sedimentisphaerales bacterium]|nr:hypothetical protein [Sedimentisphaerales bacterium]
MSRITVIHEDHNKFVQAVKDRKKVIVTYYSGQYRLNLTKLCVPLQYSRSDRRNDSDCYYLWDPEGEIGSRVLVLPPSRVMYMELSDDIFEPDEYITPEKDCTA